MKLPSLLEAALPEGPLPITTVMDRLQDGQLPLHEFEVVQPSADGATWELLARWQGEKAPVSLRIHDIPMMERMSDAHLEFLDMGDQLHDAVRSCAHGVAVEAELHDDSPLDSFHQQLQVLAKVAPNCAGVLDRSACAARSAEWLVETASACVPPHPTTLYTVHAVGDGEGPRWLHTHGLLRCGRIELDVLDVPAPEVGLMCEFLNAVCAIMLDTGVPEPGETFWAGHDLDIHWLPVDDGLRALPRVRGAGGADDRDEVHTVMRGVLGVTRPGRLWGQRQLHPTIHLPVLNNHPVLYVSDMETARRGVLAHERFARFHALFQTHGEHPAMSFLIKLGLETPDGSREHPWFTFHGFTAGHVDATCINQPHQLPGIYEGHRGRHPVEQMTDFVVLGPWGEGSPETIADVERIVADERLMAEFEALFSEDE